MITMRYNNITMQSGREVKHMGVNEKTDITNTVMLLSKLDMKSLLLIESGARLLAARQEMDKDSQSGRQLQET